MASSLAAQAALGPPVPMHVPRSVSGALHPITMEETLALREVTAFALSPDGRQVAFALQQARSERNAYASAIFVAPIGEHVMSMRKLADIPDVAALGWTTDGASVTYIARANGVRQVWRMPAVGGTPQQITRYAAGVGTGLAAERVTDFPLYAFSPDGRYLAYFTWDTAAVRAARDRQQAPFVFDETTMETRLDVLQPPSWRTMPLHAELWLKELASGRTEHVWQSPSTLQVNADPAGTIPPELAWSPDSRAIALLYDAPQ